MALNLLSSLIGALPEGLSLLIGLGAAAWLFGRSRAAAGALVAGLALMALYLLLAIVHFPLITALAQSGTLEGDALTLTASVTNLVLAAIHGAGILALLIAICVGPAPARLEEVEE